MAGAQIELGDCIADLLAHFELVRICESLKRFGIIHFQP